MDKKVRSKLYSEIYHDFYGEAQEICLNKTVSKDRIIRAIYAPQIRKVKTNESNIINSTLHSKISDQDQVLVIFKIFYGGARKSVSRQQSGKLAS